jgi:FtsZ-interacting cell division protein YlmF
LQFVFVGDLFLPSNEPLGRYGPTLDQFLSSNTRQSNQTANQQQSVGKNQPNQQQSKTHANQKTPKKFKKQNKPKQQKRLQNQARQKPMKQATAMNQHFEKLIKEQKQQQSSMTSRVVLVGPPDYNPNILLKK